MIRNRLLTMSLLLPFMVLSSLAHAAPTSPEKGPGKAKAIEKKVPAPRVGPQVKGDQSGGKDLRSCTYQGGPKSSLLTCQ